MSHWFLFCVPPGGCLSIYIAVTNSIEKWTDFYLDILISQTTGSESWVLLSQGKYYFKSKMVFIHLDPRGSRLHVTIFISLCNSVLISLSVVQLCPIS